MRFKLLSFISSFLMNNSSSFMLLDENTVETMTKSANILDAASNLIGVLGEYIYSVVKWGLYAIDVIFLYLRQLCGLEMDMSSLNAAFSEDSDIIFSLLLSNSEQVLDIIKALIGIAIILIIVFSIIAIVKSQFNSLKSDTTGEINTIFRTAVKSFFLIIVVPFIAILGIIASNVLLKSLYNATSVYKTNSISSAVFSAASTSANRYRDYAQTGKRIPIYYDFSKQQEILNYYDKNPGNATMDEYLVSESNKIYTTYQMFNSKSFTTFSSLKTDEEKEKYYETFDANPNAEESMKPYKKIRAYQSEYYVMADVIDYAVRSNNILYIKTIEQVLDSFYALLDENAFQSICRTFNIQLCHGETVLYNTNDITRNIYANIDWDIIRFYSDYIGANEEGEPIERQQIEYTHVRGSTDEIDGAVFIITLPREFKRELTNAMQECYYPLCRGEGQYGLTTFESEYIRKGQIVAAKGIFNESGYPTAIKLSNDKSTIVFYRDKLVQLSIGDSGNILGLSVVESNESGGIIRTFKAVGKFIASIFTPKKLVPNITLDMSAVTQTYTKETTIPNKLYNGGRLHIGYMYSGVLTNVVFGKMYDLKIYNIFHTNKINYFILLLGTFLLLKSCGLAVFALIKRAYDLFLIFVFYPTVCAMYPLDEGKAMGEWFRIYTSKIFLTYGLILGINFVIMLFPVIGSIEFFTPAEVASTKIIKRLGNLLFMFTPKQISALMNLFVAVLFQIVAFTMLDSASSVIANIAGGEDHKSDNPFGAALKLVMTAWSLPGKLLLGPFKAFKAFKSVPKLKDEFKNKASQLVPMGELIRSSKDRINLEKKKHAQKEAYRDLKEVLDSNSTNKAQVEEAMKKFAQAQKGYTNALEKPREDRKAEDARKKDEEKSGVSRSSRAGDEMSADVKTDKELKNDAKEAEKHLKYLSKKEKKGKLSDEEEKAKERYTEMRENANSELSQRKSDKEGKKEADAELSRLEEKKKSGFQLTEEEEKKFGELTQKRTEIENRESNRKTGRAEQKQEIKQQKKDEKEKEKQAKKEAEEEKLFRHTGNRGKQKRVLKNLDKEASEIEKKFTAMGGQVGGKELSQMSNEEIKAAVGDPNSNLSTDQMQLLKQYQSKRDRSEILTKINVGEYEAAQNAKANKQTKKDNKLLRSRNAIGRGIRNRSASKQGAKAASQLEDIQKQLADFGPVNASNIGKYKKLKSKSAKLEQTKKTSDTWAQNNNKETRKEMRHDAKEARRKRMSTKYARRNAIKYLSSHSGDLSEAAIAEHIRKQKQGKYKNWEREEYDKKKKEESEKKKKEERKNGGKKQEE